MRQVLRLPHPPRYKPSSIKSEGNLSDERISLDWAYKSGEYDRVKKARKILLSEKEN